MESSSYHDILEESVEPSISVQLTETVDREEKLDEEEEVCPHRHQNQNHTYHSFLTSSISLKLFQYWKKLQRIIMNVAITIFGVGIGVGLILGDTLRPPASQDETASLSLSSPLDSTNNRRTSTSSVTWTSSTSSSSSATMMTYNDVNYRMIDITTNNHGEVGIGVARGGDYSSLHHIQIDESTMLPVQ